MLHLDQNHSTLSSPHSKPNLILPSTARPDQHSLRSWSAAGHDEKPFFQEQQDLPVADQTSSPPTKPEIPAPSSETPTEPTASTGSLAPGNAEDPKLSDQSPSSPADATSPAIESTSSLTPPPSATSPAFSSVDLPDGETSEQQKVEGTEEEDKSKAEVAADAAEKPSRSSTPLSELSSASEGDEPSAGDKKDSEEGRLGTDAGGAAAAGKSSTSAGLNGNSQANATLLDTNVARDQTGGEQRLRQGAGSRAQSIASKHTARR